MNNSIILAIGKGIKAAIVSKASGELEAGTYPIDTMIHVTGQIKKGEDYEQVIAQKSKPWALFAVAMSKVNGATMASIVREAEDIEKMRETEVKKSAEAELAKIKAGALTTCKGNVTTKVEFTEVVAVSEKEEASEAVTA